MIFKTPKFIEVEDKIIGPFTFKQFAYICGGIGMGYISTKILPFFILKSIFFVFFGGLGLALAFIKPNGKPFSSFLESAIRYYLGSKIYIWKRGDKKEEKIMEKKTENEEAPITSDEIHQLAEALNKKHGN